MDARTEYLRWLNAGIDDEEMKAELKTIGGNDKEIEDRFYQNLAFGTGGLRGILGAGTNRMNRYTVRRAALGLARRMLIEHADAKEKGIVIAHDSRIGSIEFALDSALVIAAAGVKAYLFESLRPTPELSFAIRHLGTVSGIVITASHNPAEYNGFKAYGADGGQITPETADAVLAEMNAIDPLTVPVADRAEAEAKGLIVTVGEDVDKPYIDHVLSLRPDPELLSRTGVDLNIVYTPLHGAGNKPVRRALEAAGFKNVHVVPEQEMPDGRFPTVKSPNPENAEAFTIAIRQADAIGAELIVGTDPDSDRMGLMVPTAEGWKPLTGNQVGCLFLEYICERRKAPTPDDYAVTTIVSTRMVDAVAEAYGAKVYRVLTGFKYIGETIDRQEKAGNPHFLLGFEESYGYLTGGYIRDKDAVIASVLACEMAAYYKTQGRTLMDQLKLMYEKYGCYQERLLTVTLPGLDGVRRRGEIMKSLRVSPLIEVGGRNITDCVDYTPGIDDLPPADVMLYTLEGGAWMCVRPSGTEPKLKVYLGVKEADPAAAAAEADRLIKCAGDMITYA